MYAKNLFSRMLRIIGVLSVLLCSATDSFGAKGIFRKVEPNVLGFSSLSDGEKVIFVYQTDTDVTSLAMGEEVDNYRVPIKVPLINKNTIENPEGAEVFEVRVDETFEATFINQTYKYPYQFAIKQPDGSEKYLYTWTGPIMKMVGSDETNKAGFHFRLEHDTTNKRFELKGKVNGVQYKAAFGDDPAGFYGITGYDPLIRIYKLVPGTDVADVSAPTIDFDYNDVTMKADDGTTIYYTLDGSEPTVNTGLKYDIPVRLKSSATVKAIAVSNGVSSDVSELVCGYVETPVASWHTVNQMLDDSEDANEAAFPLEGLQGGILISLTAPEGHTLWYSLTQQDGASATQMMRAPSSDVSAHSIPLTEEQSGHVDNILVQTTGYLNYYSQHPDTKKFSHVRQLMFSGQTSANDIYYNDGENNAPIYYNIQGQQVNTPSKGLYLCRRGHIVTKIVIP